MSVCRGLLMDKKSEQALLAGSKHDSSLAPKERHVPWAQLGSVNLPQQTAALNVSLQHWWAPGLPWHAQPSNGQPQRLAPFPSQQF